MIEHSYITNKVKVFNSGINKKGVFALKPIRKDEVICVWGGHVITEKEFKHLKKRKFKNIDDYATRLADGFYLVSCKHGNLEDDDFFNHSCNPNAGIKGHLLMVAMRDIKKKEEITYDYCMTDADYDYSFKCSCNSKNCRGNITTKDWKNNFLQRKYRNYFSWYVQQKINKLKKQGKSES
jgi:uncharacterized protein